MLIYKILLPEEWAHFEAAGRFDGSPFDAESGFIHCSGREQVAETVRRVFAGEVALIVVALDADVFGPSLRWEAVADRGQVFPHVYGSLPSSAVVAVYPVDGPDTVEAALRRA